MCSGLSEYLQSERRATFRRCGCIDHCNPSLDEVATIAASINAANDGRIRERVVKSLKKWECMNIGRSGFGLAPASLVIIWSAVILLSR